MRTSLLCSRSSPLWRARLHQRLPSSTRRLLHQDTIQEGDIVILRRTDDPSAAVILTKPLKTGGKVQSHRGDYEHSSIIGKKARDVVKSTSSKTARIHIPTLAEYVTLTPRLVTPVYPGEANLIVSLLDIHVTPPPSEAAQDEPPLELLEAGTGHGSLTLHLARAIHGANSAQPQISSTGESGTQKSTLVEMANDCHTSEAEAAQVVWKRSRRAILHTLDISEHHSNHARKIVRGFRKGLYAGSVDFHVGDLSKFVDEEMRRRATVEPFLSYVVLDLPSTEDHLKTVAKAMRDDAVLTVFCPSVTQIAECVEHIKKHDLPFFLDQVVELGATFGAGRPWDIRVVKPRAVQRMENEHVEVTEAVKSDGEKNDKVKSTDGSGTVQPEVKRDEGRITGGAPTDVMSNWKTICRPEVGGRITGGGFLGLWRRTKDLKSTVQTQQ